jgi:DNA polymerase III subunit delta
MQMDELLRDIAARRFQPVYFLHGEEPFFIDRIEAAVEEHALAEAERSFNQTIVYGKDVDHLTLLDNLRRYPMMAERQVVILREAQDMKGLAELAGYFEQPSPTTVFVVSHKHKKADLRTKLGKALQSKSVVLFESKKLYDNQVADWVATYCKAQKLSIEPAAAALLAEYLGTDLGRVANELDKLAINVPAGTPVTARHIEEQVGISKEYNVFELQKALATRDMPKVARITAYFNANMRKNPLIVTLSSLHGYFTKLYLLHHYKAQGSNDAELVKQLDLRSDWFLKEYKLAANQYPQSKVIQILGYLREYDLRAKGVDTDLTNTPEEALMQELMWKILN